MPKVKLVTKKEGCGKMAGRVEIRKVFFPPPPRLNGLPPHPVPGLFNLRDVWELLGPPPPLWISREEFRTPGPSFGRTDRVRATQVARAVLDGPVFFTT
uniref:Uncharacterized protein n=1 Tax=Timema monikensis TaxID=170555 RepID=A0A7R9ECX1_9NEOP|nr:unnamed protein product [Timema monikensis]